MIGLGLGLGLGGRAGGSAAAFDPATLSLTGWWRASFAASPWVGVASAGSSGSRDLTEATNPPAVGSALNSHASADFDGTNDKIGTALTAADFTDVNAYSGWVLFQADAIGTNSAEGTAYENDPLIRNGNSNFGVTLRSSPQVQVWHFDGAWKAAEVTIATGTPQLVRFKYDGTNIKVSVNSGAYTSRAVGNMSAGTAAMSLGGESFAATFFNGRIWDVALTDQVLSDADLDNVKAYINARYALAL